MCVALLGFIWALIFHYSLSIASRLCILIGVGPDLLLRYHCDFYIGGLEKVLIQAWILRLDFVYMDF
jgi:hypothetical protein